MRDLKEIGMSYMGKITERKAPSVAKIKQLEQALELKLPKSYKHFLKKANGFAPTLNTFSVGRDGWSLECFYHVADDLSHGYNVAERSKWPSEALGHPVIAIAGDGSGDQLIFDPMQDKEALYMWSHESSQKPVKVANSLGHFWICSRQVSRARCSRLRLLLDSVCNEYFYNYSLCIL